MRLRVASPPGRTPGPPFSAVEQTEGIEGTAWSPLLPREEPGLRNRCISSLFKNARQRQSRLKLSVTCLGIIVLWHQSLQNDR